MKIQLTQQIIISNKSSKFAPLDELCFLSKNLYNVALYNIRQYYKEYDDSVDFGKYDLETAKEAFGKHNVYYNNKNVFNEFCLKKIDCI